MWGKKNQQEFIDGVLTQKAIELSEPTRLYLINKVHVLKLGRHL